MSHNVNDAIRALDGATKVTYIADFEMFEVFNPSNGFAPKYYDTDFRVVEGPLGHTAEPPRAHRAIKAPRAMRVPVRPTAEMIAARTDERLVRSNPGMRCRSIIPPTDEQHFCAHCHQSLPIGGRAYGVGDSTQVVPVCSLGCATEYARHGGSHHGG